MGTRNQWTEVQAQEWYRSQPWLVGYNFVPSYACNTTEFWQRESFDAEVIAHEFGIARSIGFNTCRIFVQYKVWESDRDALLERMERLLDLAEQHQQAVMFVLFDDCAFGDPIVTEPYLGKQQEPIPGMIASSWTPSPGHSVVTDRSKWPLLEEYVRSIVGRFAQDSRVVVWDLYNEPGNMGMVNKSLPLVNETFVWSRLEQPQQPLTIGMWNWAPEYTDLIRACASQSDIISFHIYAQLDEVRKHVGLLQQNERPILCTEWFSRQRGGNIQTDMPYFKQQNIGCYQWGLVNGRTQCQFAWDSPAGAPEPEDWFHDLFHNDGTPYRSEEINLIRSYTSNPRV